MINKFKDVFRERSRNNKSGSIYKGNWKGKKVIKKKKY